jgi:cobalt-zinc-cadmium efflux system protein
MHDHDHPHGSARGDTDGRSSRALLYALGINTAFFLVELGGAYLANSLTLFADAVHMLTDSASLGLALFAAWVAARPADSRRTYGYRRAEVVGAFLNALFLLAVVGYVLLDAFRRFRDPRPVDATVVVIVGVLGLAANLAGAWFLSGHRESLNVEGAFLHLLADAAGSVAAIALGVALSFTDLYVLDPLFAVLVAGLVLYSAKGLLAESLNILLQGTPRGVDIDEVAAALRALDGVEDVHDLHVWALDSSRNALSAHVVISSSADPDRILDRSRRALARRFGVDHATIQLERGGRIETEEFDCYPPDRN